VIHYATAYAYLDRGDYAEAERRFTTVIELEPDFARGWDGRGQARLLKGDYEEALLDFDQAILLKPNLPQAYSHRAFARMASRDLAGARRDAEKALSINDRLVDSHIVMGSVLAAEGLLGDALLSYDRAIALAPEAGSVWLWRGRFFRDEVGDYERALADLDRAVELDPARAAMYLDRAITLMYAQGPVEKIKHDLEEAISLSQEPRLPDTLEQAERLLELVKEAEATGAPIILPQR
jgi:tetratricopeptide (TPR) repeat protein